MKLANSTVEQTSSTTKTAVTSQRHNGARHQHRGRAHEQREHDDHEARHAVQGPRLAGVEQREDQGGQGVQRPGRRQPAPAGRRAWPTAAAKPENSSTFAITSLSSPPEAVCVPRTAAGPCPTSHATARAIVDDAPPHRRRRQRQLAAPGGLHRAEEHGLPERQPQVGHVQRQTGRHQQDPQPGEARGTGRGVQVEGARVGQPAATGAGPGSEGSPRDGRAGPPGRRTGAPRHCSHHSRASGTSSSRPELRVSTASMPGQAGERPAARRAPTRTRASVSSRNSASLYTAWKKSAVGNTEMEHDAPERDPDPELGPHEPEQDDHRAGVADQRRR